MCVSHLFCPTSKKEGGTQNRDFWVCVRVPPRFFSGVPANGIKRVSFGTKLKSLETGKKITTALTPVPESYLLIQSDRNLVQPRTWKALNIIC